MGDDPKDDGQRDEIPEGEEPTRELSDMDINQDGVVDPIEEAVSQVEESGDDQPDEAETPVEVQPPGAASIGSSVQLAQPKKPWISRFIPRTRRERQIQALQAGYTDMLDMMRSISHHLERQSEVHDNLIGALEHFPDAVDSLRNVGKATEQQTEMLGLVKERLESNASHEQQVVDSMNRFNNTLTMMDDTSKTTSDTIGSLVDRSRESEESLRAMLERSERRTTLLLGFLGLLAVGAIASALYFGVGGKKLDLGAWTGSKGDAPVAGDHGDVDAASDGVEAASVAPAVEKKAADSKAEAADLKKEAATSEPKAKAAKAADVKKEAATSDPKAKAAEPEKAAAKDKPKAKKTAKAQDDEPAKKDDGKKSGKTEGGKKSSKKSKKKAEEKAEAVVKAVDAKAADAARETGVTAQDAAAKAGAGEAVDNLSVPTLDEDLAKDATPNKTSKKAPKKNDKKDESADKGEPSESIIKKVVSVLAESEEGKAAPDINIEPVE